MNMVERLRSGFIGLLRLDRRVDEIKINQGRILAEMLVRTEREELRHYEFKVFSQWGEDGILQFLTANLDIKHRTFIEFGVEDFFESNCRFLMMKDFWRGFVIDGSEKNIQRLRSSYFYWQYPLVSRVAFITAENVVELLNESNFDRNLGILSVDIDGVDYFVLARALEHWRPSILVVEYNALFGAHRAVSVPYDSRFQRGQAHFSNVYYGASLPAFAHLASRYGYALVGVNGAGSNAFFVRSDLLNARVRAVQTEDVFRDSSFREGRNTGGTLTLANDAERLRPVRELPLIDVVSGMTFTVGELGAAEE